MSNQKKNKGLFCENIIIVTNLLDSLNLDPCTVYLNFYIKIGQSCNWKSMRIVKFSLPVRL